MKKITYPIYLAFTIAFTLYSCTEDFIDVESTIETEDALTVDKAVELVNAVYNPYLDWGMNSFSWIGISSITSDDADKGSDPGDTGVDKDKMDALTFDATTLSFANIWTAHYNCIQRANQAINRIEIFEGLDEDLRKRLIGEAKFLRAFTYFRLVKMFGGVPLIAKLPDENTDPDSVVAKATKEQVYAQIEEDLNDAIAVLPLKGQYPDVELGRATKGAAQTMLAKVSMYQGKWQQVMDLTNDVIDSNEYDLTPNYEDIWKESGENNIESIFEIQCTASPIAAGIDGYSLAQGARGEGGWGWGFNTPSQDLIDSYEAGDLRREATVIYRGETLFDGRLVPNTVDNKYYNQKAYSSANSDAWISGKNLRILRYAEVLLMNAEAATHVGGDVATPLNRVRNRAGLGNATTTDQQAVWNERRWELAFEHDRYFDLVRQGRAGMVMRAHGKFFVDGKHEVFPIPQEQINKAGGKLVQNNGYE